MESSAKIENIFYNASKRVIKKVKALFFFMNKVFIWLNKGYSMHPVLDSFFLLLFLTNFDTSL